MPDGDDISIEEKRVYAGSAGRTDVYVASADGLVRVAVSGDKVGHFSMVADVSARDVSVLPRSNAPDLLGVATGEDLLVATIEGDDPTFESAGIGASTAVGLTRRARDGAAPREESGTRMGRDGGAFLAAADDGEIVLVGADSGDGEAGAPSLDVTLASVGTVTDPRAVDAGMIAAGDGVYRTAGLGSEAIESGAKNGGTGRRLEHVGLSDVRDVAGAGVPLAGTAEGLYWLANGWRDAIDGPIDVVAADGEGHALAAGPQNLRVHRGHEWGEESWDQSDLPVDGAVTALGYGPGLAIAVTDGGALCVDAGDGWRHQIVGVRDVSGIAVRPVDSTSGDRSRP
ncbi:hypothetical protein ACERIT_04845 [Halopenitus sp. H-Gu1]|uniref:HVO_0234 family beta-propeller protein n=1 Tax=Halopenitus sp. H-Gu1 TaxID=3242697 RepID=UPI00359D8DFD